MPPADRQDLFSKVTAKRNSRLDEIGHHDQQALGIWECAEIGRNR